MTYTQFVFAPNNIPQKTAAPTPQQVTNINGTTSEAAPQGQAQTQNLPLASPNISNNLARVPSLEQSAQANKKIIHTGLSTVTITQLGARVLKLELDKFQKELNGAQSFNMIASQEGSSLPGGLQLGALSDEGLNYEVKEIKGFEQRDPEHLFLPQNQEAALTMTASLPSGQIFTKTFHFKSNSYLFNIEASVSSSAAPTDALTISWPINIHKEDLNQRYDPYFFSLLSDANKVQHISAVSTLDELLNAQSAQWLAFGDRYFGTSLIPTSKTKNVRIDAAEGSFVLYARGDQNTINVGIFAGPKIYQLLKNQGLQLERTIDLGFFSFVAYPLLQLLKFLFSIFGNYGVAIVALTLLVKTIFYPLNKASLKSMRAMQELGPEIAALKERIKDSTQLNQETLALYKRKGVNPMGGCFPVFIQIPVFFGLYSALQNAVELRHAPFALWVKDLATPEKLPIFGINCPIIVLAMGAIMFIQQYRTPMPNMDPTQRKVTLGMSLMFTFMFLIFPFPAGLAIYMLINTTISLVQQQCLKSETLNKPFQMTLAASIAILALAFIFSKL